MIPNNKNPEHVNLDKSMPKPIVRLYMAESDRKLNAFEPYTKEEWAVEGGRTIQFGHVPKEKEQRLYVTISYLFNKLDEVNALHSKKQDELLDLYKKLNGIIAHLDDQIQRHLSDQLVR